MPPRNQLFTFPRATARGRGSGDDTASHGALPTSAATGLASRLPSKSEAPRARNGDQVCDQKARASARQMAQSVTVPGQQRPPRALQHPAGEEGTQVHTGLGATPWRPSPRPGPPRGRSWCPRRTHLRRRKIKRGRTSRWWRDAGRASLQGSEPWACYRAPSCMFQGEGFCLQFSEGTRPSCFIVSYVLKFSSEMYTPLFSGLAAKCCFRCSVSSVYSLIRAFLVSFWLTSGLLTVFFAL